MVDEKEKLCEVEDPEELHQRWHLVWVSGVLLVLIVGSLWVAPLLFPDDEYVLSRALILRIPVDLINAWVLFVGLVLLDAIAPGCLLKQANSSPLSASILGGAFIIGMALLMMGN